MKYKIDLHIKADRLLPSGVMYPKDILDGAIKRAVDINLPFTFGDDLASPCDIQYVAGKVTDYDEHTGKVTIETVDTPMGRLVDEMITQRFKFSFSFSGMGTVDENKVTAVYPMCGYLIRKD